MLSFKEFLEEKLITFNKKAYPKFGNIVILAGGAGSGKGFILSKLIGIEGKVLNVDDLKEMKNLDKTKLAKQIYADTGIDIGKLNTKNQDDTATLHMVLKKYIKSIHSNFLKSVSMSDPRRLQNIIFDVTLKDMDKFSDISNIAQQYGYDRQNIHLVWIINDVKIAQTQNKTRSRVVADDILVKTHKGAARTMRDILNMGDNLSKYINGDIWLAFNNKEEGDTVYAKSASSAGGYILTANTIKIKNAGTPGLNDITKDIGSKIFKYTGEKF